MPETDPRTPDPFKRAPGGDHTGTATDGAVAVPSDAPSAAPSAGPSAGLSAAGPSAEPVDPEQPALRAESRAAGSRGAHSKAGPSKPAKESKTHSPLYLWIKEVATVVAIAVVLSFLIKTFLFRAFYIPSESMVNTLDVNDRIFVNLLVPEPFALSRGDVVVFKRHQGLAGADAGQG